MTSPAKSQHFLSLGSPVEETVVHHCPSFTTLSWTRGVQTYGSDFFLSGTKYDSDCQPLKENFDSLEKVNFDSLKREILTVKKGKF
jgi:hypothetical protein